MIYAYTFSHSLIDLFWISATVGTTLFMLRMLMVFVGDLSDFHHSDHSGHHYDDHSMPSLKLVTLHSLAGFLMMFGWTGLAALVQYGFSPALSLILAFLVGLFVMILVALIFKAAQRLEAQGATFNARQTIGLVGEVYQRIPAQGVGKIHVNIHGVTRELLAQSINNEPIESFEAIKIINSVDQEIVQVVLLRKEQP